MDMIAVHTMSEQFKQGWVAGYYDSLSGDGLRYLDDVLRYGIRSSHDEEFMAGYRAGKQRLYNIAPQAASGALLAA